VIEAVSSAGSFLDGGGSRPLQRAAIPLLEDEHVRKETQATHAAFRDKRERMIARLERLGIRTIGDLLWHLPTRHLDFSKIVPFIGWTCSPQ